MGFHAVPNCIGLVIAGVGPDGQLRHVLHAKSAGAHPTTAELQAAANVVAAWAASSSNYAASISSACSIQSVTAIDESVIDGAQLLSTGTFLPTPGLLTGNPVPSSVTCAVSLRTGFGGRSHRGRFYSWPMNVGQIDSTGNFATAYVGDLVTRLQTLISNLLTAGTPLAIKSNVLTSVTQVLTAVAEDYATDSQRRRLKGRGR